VGDLSITRHSHNDPSGEGQTMAGTVTLRFTFKLHSSLMPAGCTFGRWFLEGSKAVTAIDTANIRRPMSTRGIDSATTASVV